ncbi:hypothetical protein GQR58_013198 [Nymphon striatum]|nr:hypothetical protein GQR58_013198 [Nymphon striatum]
MPRHAVHTYHIPRHDIRNHPQRPLLRARRYRWLDPYLVTHSKRAVVATLNLHKVDVKRHVLQLAHALQALYPLSHIDRARPRQPPTAAEPRRQQLGDSGQNRPTCLSILTCRGLLPPLQPLLSPPPELFLEADQLTGHVESILVDCSLKIPPHSTAATMRMLTDRPGTTYLGPSAKSTVESSENISSKDEDPTSPSNVEIPPMDAAAQIEEELDLDLDDLKIDESIDPADVNIDDLLSDD